MGVAGVLLLTFVGIFYVSQTYQSASARYTIDALLMERQAMLMELKTQEGSTVPWGSERVVQRWALSAGLDRLPRRVLHVPDR